MTPAPVEIEYPVLLESPIPHIRAYPVETVIAEKFEALVTLGIANSRLKDFYDLWQISTIFKLNQSECADAVRHTFERRGTTLPVDTPTGLTGEFAAAWEPRWQTFLGRERMAPVSNNFVEVIADLRNFLLPMIHVSYEELLWSPGGPWSRRADRNH